MYHPTTNTVCLPLMLFIPARRFTPELGQFFFGQAIFMIVYSNFHNNEHSSLCKNCNTTTLNTKITKAFNDKCFPLNYFANFQQKNADFE